ncbi:AAA family ATPase [Streptobacillus moniliformis]|uniref:AAA family ATPase n=1 Tax=Streptobacillus moniliformis TaxID=34105 RepID=UPI0007E4B5D3|nr:AAA family ATPase [Streptobacillus moniliformis]
MNELLLKVVGLSIWYDRKNIIENAEFTINKNEIVALVGINGSGKTTLINTLVGIHFKYSLETLIFNNRKISFDDINFKLNRIAVFSQDDSFRYWSFMEYIKFVFETYNINMDSEYIDYLIDGFNFREYINYMRKDLSMGNKKKFALIVAFGLRLPFLIFDEPVDGLDFGSTAFLYRIIKEYKSFGSILMSTHIAESISEACDKLIFLNEGKITSKISIQGKISTSDIFNLVKEKNL